ncbi:hypothetical protein FB472_2280 [Rhodoglobus vestalii]|uniref:Uncharacterized protein n=1 Tax=Rhodoglobus vestalii TaxID=193384 RepID=A0A8H2K835_9MICO|nr:hypothetical protein [Rhodoglobus vestalii]TQO20639.1 hypothetical protein FB472_2280 [Rhodoglobus vestalii]
MSLETLPIEGNPIVRIGKSRSELVWPNGSRRRFHTPEIEQAQMELNRVTRLPKLGSTASPQQKQNRADSVFESRMQLGQAVRAFIRSSRET